MRLSGIRLVALVSATLASTVAVAATPLPDPPFPGGGFVPATKDVLKQELGVLKVLVKYGVKRASCDSALIDDLVLAYTSNAGNKIMAVQDKWVECVQKVGDRYVYERDKVLLKGTPACLDQPGIDSLRAQLDGQLAAGSSIAYCDGDNAAPDPVTALNVPDKIQEATGEAEAGKRIVKSYYEALKCLYGVVPRLFREQAVSEDNKNRMSYCLDKIAARVDDTMAKLDQTNKLPSCLPEPVAVAAAISARDFGTSSSGGIFCASPGGAFVDGAPTL
jgi:hypothetical protein